MAHHDSAGSQPTSGSELIPDSQHWIEPILVPESWPKILEDGKWVGARYSVYSYVERVNLHLTACVGAVQ